MLLHIILIKHHKIVFYAQKDALAVSNRYVLFVILAIFCKMENVLIIVLCKNIKHLIMCIKIRASGINNCVKLKILLIQIIVLNAHHSFIHWV